ncbi:hypothetical protein V8C34DRAFT_299177 [Trichoderma compactum]
MPGQVLENWCWTQSQLKRLGRHYSYPSSDYLQAWSEAANGKPRPTERLSDSEIANLVRNKHFNSALLYLRQTAIGMFDMLVHQISSDAEAEERELAVKWNQLRREVLPLDGGEAVNGDWAWGHGYANFGHFVDIRMLVTTAIYCEQSLVSVPPFFCHSFICLFSESTYLLTEIISLLCISSLVYAADVFNGTFKLDSENTVNGRRYRHAVLEKGASKDEMTL